MIEAFNFLGFGSQVFNLSPSSSPLSSPQLSVKFRKVASPTAKTGVHFNAKGPDGYVSVPLSSMDPRSTTKSIFQVTGMSCSSCVSKIEREVSKRTGKKCTFEDIDVSVGKLARAHFGCKK